MPPPRSLPPGAHDAIYRVAQEAMANVARHARASHVRSTLGVHGSRFELRIVDNGQGFDPRTAAHGMGTANMNARAASFNGRLTIASGPKGTEVALVLPLTDRSLRGAWGMVGVFGLMVLSGGIFFVLRGHPPEQPGPAIVGLFGAWTIWRLASAYRRRARKQSP
jgi:hypothetical protein